MLVQKVQASLRHLGAAGRGLLLAVSGGGDSMALLDVVARLASELKVRVEAATVDHALRTGSRDEALAVQRECAARGVPHHLRVAAIAPGAGVEARARVARYEALESVRKEAGLEYVVTAHTSTDQAETVLMRLSRGSALSGAAGVLERRGNVLRPMLACSREEVRTYLAAFGIPYARDPMNEDPSFLRTRVRQRVLPALEDAAGPGAAERIARFARFAAEDDRLLVEQASAALRRMRGAALAPEGARAIDVVALASLPRALRRRVFALLLEEEALPIDADLIARMEAAVAGESAGVPLGERAELRVTGGWMRVVRGLSGLSQRQAQTQAQAQGFAGGLEGSGLELALDGPAVELPETRLRLGWSSERRSEERTQPVRSLGESRLLVRFRQPGDRVRLPSGRTRKLQDVLVDARVPREARARVPVLVDREGRVVCVVGVWPRAGLSPARPQSDTGITWLWSTAID